MRVFNFKSLRVEQKEDGVFKFVGLEDKDILNEIIPDALAFVKNNELNLGAMLCNLNGVDLYILPTMSIREVQEQWKQDYYRLSGLDY